MPISIPTAFNPGDKGGTCLISPNERVITYGGGSGSSMTRTYTKISSGKRYAEFTRTVSGSWMFGLSSASGNLNGYCGASSESIGLYNGTIYHGGSGIGTIAGATTGTYGVAVDADARTVRFIGPGGVSADLAFTLTGDVYLAGGPDGGPGGSLTINTGQEAFAYTVPSGYTAGFPLLERYAFQGVVRDENGDPVARTIRALVRSTGVPVGEVVSDPVTGAYVLAPVPNNAVKHILYGLDDGDLNAQVWDHMVPT